MLKAAIGTWGSIHVMGVVPTETDRDVRERRADLLVVSVSVHLAPASYSRSYSMSEQLCSVRQRLDS